MPFKIQQNYQEKFTELSPKRVSFHREDRVWRIAKEILSVVFFPVGLYRAWHRLVGLAVVPASIREVLIKTGWMQNSQQKLNDSLKKLKNQGWTLQRICIESDGLQIDATLLLPPNAIQNRWTLYSTGNNEKYEDILSLDTYCQDLFGEKGLQTNVLLFNYPGVGKSGGLPSRSGCVQAYRTLVRWLEDEVQAKELIGFGHSIGGGIQGEAIAHHKEKEGIRYCFIKDRTFSHLSDVAKDLTDARTPKFKGILGSIVKKIVELSSWNINTLEASLQTRFPEVIVQTSQSPGTNPMVPLVPDKNTELWRQLVTDDIIRSEMSLAIDLDTQKKRIQNVSKTVLLVPESHNKPIGKDSILHLKNLVNDLLKPKEASTVNIRPSTE